MRVCLSLCMLACLCMREGESVEGSGLSDFVQMFTFLQEAEDCMCVCLDS